MTACKDSLNGKKAVSATLAGVLAVGMVPAAAFAADGAQAADTQSGDGVDLLWQSPAEAFSNATVTEAYDLNGNKVDTGEAVSFAYKAGTAQGLDVQEVTIDGYDDPIATTDANKFVVRYFKQGTDGKATTDTATGDQYGVAAPTSAGKYVAVVKAVALNGATNEFNGGKLEIPFEIKESKLTGATPYAVQEDANDLSVTDLTYNGNNWAATDAQSGKHTKLGFQIDGKKLVEGTDYNVTFIKPGTAQTATITNVIDAGSYVAVLTGMGAYTGKVEVPVTVNKLDLSTLDFADISIAQPESGVAEKPTADDLEVTNATVGAIFDAPAQADISSWGNTGSYNFTVSPAKEQADSNFVKADGKVKTGSVKVNIVGDEVEDSAFYYGTQEISSLLTDGAITIDHSVEGTADFDTSKIKVQKTAATGTTKATYFKSSEVSVAVKDADGNAVSDKVLSKPGTYTVTVSLNSAALNPAYSFGGSYTFKVKVTEGNILSADMSAYWKGKLASVDSNGNAKAELFYTGDDALQNASFVVKDQEGNTLTEGTDYTVEVKNSKGDVVDEAVNADTYTATIKSAGYTFVGSTTMTITVKAITVKPIVKDTFKNGDGETFLAYTGDAITPSFKYAALKDDGTALKDDNGDQVYVDVPADIYDLTYKYAKKSDGTFASVDEMKDKGYYKVRINLKDTEVAANYKLAAGVNPVTIKVADDRVFADVPTGEWYNDAVYKISATATNDNGETVVGPYGTLMSGYAGSALFGPNDTMTRAQVAKVLGKAAGVTVANDPTDGVVDNTKSYQTPFSDVDGSAWYAGYVAWASDTGIVTGYQDGSNAFGPEDSITREQFCLMLQRFAAKYNLYEAADGSALAAMPDASGVSSWAKDAVAWAVDKGYIGKGGVVDAQGTITRGMAAQILVRFVDDNALVNKVPLK